MQSYFLTPIITAADAETFIRELHADGRLYHFDDSPETVINIATGLPIFTADECALVRERMNEMRGLEHFDPFDLAIQLSE